MINSPHSDLMTAMQNKDNKGYKANTKDRASHRSKNVQSDARSHLGGQRLHPFRRPPRSGLIPIRTGRIGIILGSKMVSA